MTVPVQPVLPVGTDPTSDTFVVQSQPPNIGFLRRAVQPPSQVYIEASDVLTVGCATSATNEVLTISYRLLRFDGVLIHGQFTIQPPNNRTVKIHAEQLAEGFLLSMSCKAAIATTRGVTFARAFITKPSLGAGQPSYMLMADYVTTAMAPAFPNGRVLTPVEGPGNVYGFVGSTPGAGVNWIINGPANVRWRLISVRAFLTTSAVVANRTPVLQLSSGGNGVFLACGPALQPASTTYTYSWSDGLDYVYDGLGTVVEGLPSGIIIQAAPTISTAVNNMQGADQWSAPTALVEEWLDNV